MKILQIGLGSMGKRRIRCLHSLGYRDIIALDFRSDRRAEAEQKYDIQTIEDLKNIDFKIIDLMIISTPPNYHDTYIDLAIKKKIPAFVEASVVLGKLEELDKAAKKAKVMIAPSCTLRYHQAIMDIYSIVKCGKFGKITNFTYHSGQYLPDWHPFEKVKDYYVSNKETGAAREIVPFELTWLVEITGFPKRIKALVGKTMDVGADIDDTYALAMEFPHNIFGVLQVDVVSRFATRNLILNMERGQILWKWDEQAVKLYDANRQRWITYHYTQGQAATGYNKNISEDMYIHELDDFIKAVKFKKNFPNTLQKDIKILKILEAAESNSLID